MLKAGVYTKAIGRKEVNDVVLRTFFGLLILIGVYKFKIQNVLMSCNYRTKKW